MAIERRRGLVFEEDGAIMQADVPKKRILVVDDAPAVMQSMVLVLRTAGFQAAGEISAACALRVAAAHHPDILLCDVQLGEANGVELPLDIAKFLPGCRIILMSGDTTSAKILSDAHQRGYDFEVLAKPMLPEELLALLRQLRQRETQAERPRAAPHSWNDGASSGFTSKLWRASMQVGIALLHPRKSSATGGCSS
jgi:DNA-binding NtrC family response regulator